MRASCASLLLAAAVASFTASSMAMPTEYKKLKDDLVLAPFSTYVPGTCPRPLTTPATRCVCIRLPGTHATVGRRVRRAALFRQARSSARGAAHAMTLARTLVHAYARAPSVTQSSSAPYRAWCPLT
ncbi:hypothetical protein EON67_03765 [archaeon]|nr:MAG: hypothetical protein EON67_03765 [archaeon]